ncbi:hypothetical protein Pcinc_026227 [Petrolisthes cinctipes]|uniref:Uncharacterized protein n=1 Tax=Petrolisthes cinctipes TaxID=88211 RepID=A0AAE1F8X5_PETCI|nr:hypothetical protein Pcinc_026227 [Petrolisthes cinctipes]
MVCWSRVTGGDRVKCKECLDPSWVPHDLMPTAVPTKPVGSLEGEGYTPAWSPPPVATQLEYSQGGLSHSPPLPTTWRKR